MIETDVGLYNCRNRVYSLLLGVWLQRDPLGYADGMNLYEYVSGNPIRYSDPSGHSCEGLVWLGQAQPQPPARRRPVEGDPDYWDGPPDCRNPVWCYQKYLQRTVSTLGVMNCFSKGAATAWGPATAACLIGCAVLYLVPEPGFTKLGGTLCIIACGADVGSVVALLAACFNQVRQSSESAENSYCACLYWKRNHCDKDPGNMPEAGPMVDIRCSGKYGWPGFDK